MVVCLEIFICQMITLYTSVYEKNIVNVLLDGWFVNYKNDLITKKVVVVNNVVNWALYNELKQHHQDIEFVHHSDYVDQINAAFGVNLDSSKAEYYYSVQQYVSLLVETGNKFVFYVGSDCKIVSSDLTPFLQKSINLINNNPDVITTTLPWFDATKSEWYDIEEDLAKSWYNPSKPGTYKSIDPEFCSSVIFSDQVWVGNIAKLKTCDFTDSRDLYGFPPYAGNSFEKRLANYFMTHNKYRALYRTSDHYIHKSH